MHELSIALAIVDAAAEEAERNGALRVNAVHLKLGEMSGVIPDALNSAWELATEGSPIAGARLEISKAPATAFCSKCNAARQIVSISEFLCRDCGEPTGALVTGREMEVTGLDIVIPDDPSVSGSSSADAPVIDGAPPAERPIE